MIDDGQVSVEDNGRYMLVEAAVGSPLAVRLPTAAVVVEEVS